MSFLLLRKQRVRTVYLTVSSYASYRQLLEKFAEKALQAAGPWQQVEGWVARFFRRVNPELGLNPTTGEISIFLGRGREIDPSPLAPDIFALPGEITENSGFRMAICLDEFQQMLSFDGMAVENALRNEAQKQRQVGYVFAGSQPSLMEEMLSSARPFHKTGPKIFLDKIPADDWREFVVSRFRRRRRTISKEALERLLSAADLIPYDVQRLAHELWDHAELEGQESLGVEDIERVIERVIASQAVYFELQWERLSARQKAVLQVLARRGSTGIYSQNMRQQNHLGSASTVQKALQSLDGQDILDLYRGKYFFLDPVFAMWIHRSTQ